MMLIRNPFIFFAEGWLGHRDILFIKPYVYGYSEPERVEECAQEYEQARKTGKKKKSRKSN